MAKTVETPAAAPKKRTFETLKRAEIWKPAKIGEVREGEFLSVQMVMGVPMGNNPATEFVTYNFMTDPKPGETFGQYWSVSSAMLKGLLENMPFGTYCVLTAKDWYQSGNMVNKSRDFDVAPETGTVLLTPGTGHFSKKLEVVEAPEDEPATEQANGFGSDPTTVPGTPSA